MLSIKNVYKQYKVDKEDIPVLKGIEMNIRQGEFVAIVGPSGCGKTTLLNLLSGIDKVSSGEVEYFDKSTKGFSDNQWSDLRKNRIGYIFQNFNLVEHLSAQDNVELALRLAGADKKERKKAAKELLDMVGLKDRCKHLPSQLSGGQKQRVAIARALANDPNIILADEPTGAVDSATAREIMILLRKINKEKNVTIIMITHDTALANEADRKITLFDGKIISDERLVGDEFWDTTNEFDDITEDKKQQKNMKLWAAVQIALKNLSNKKKRTILTAIGTAVGIIGVLLILGMGSGAKGRIYKEVSSLIDQNMIYVTTSDKKMDENAKKEILNLKNVDGIQEQYQFTALYQNKDKVGQTFAYSLYPFKDKKENEKINLLAGALPTSDDSYEVVVPKVMAQTLAGKNKNYKSVLGKKVKLIYTLSDSSILTYSVDKECIICGISDMSVLGSGNMALPIKTASEIAKASAKDENYNVTNYNIKVKNKNIIDKTKSTIKNMGFDATTDADQLEKINSYIDIATYILMLIAGVSLIVSAIMITLVMYMSVIEQTRVIGVMRAIGARRKDIKRIFISEGGVIGLFSGIIGVLFADLIGMVINAVINQVFKSFKFDLYQISIPQVLLCLLFSILLSMAASYLPARKACKTDPVVALGYYQ